MKPHRSKRGDVPSLAQAYTMKALELEAAGHKIIRLHLGQPSTPAPKAAIDAVINAEQTELLGYSSGVGIAPLRERIAAHYQETYSVDLDPRRVVVTIGASGALMLAIIACFDHGAKFGLPYPVYPAYAQAIKMLGLEGVPVPTQAENHFQLKLEDLEKVGKHLDGLIVASPSNPTGAVIPPHELEKIIQYCDANNIQLISDEIYHGLIYEGAPKVMSSLNFSNAPIVINSFSKYYSMPGWRVGWMVIPEDMINRIACEARNLYLAPPSPSQFAALAAMDATEELDQNVARYAKNRAIMMRELPKAGFDQFISPDGAFYMYVHVAHLHDDSVKFCMDLLNEAYITSMPGTSFDPIHGHHYVRFSYAGATEEIEEAMEQLKTWRS